VLFDALELINNLPGITDEFKSNGKFMNSNDGIGLPSKSYSE
jgi:hypothetical protein